MKKTTVFSLLTVLILVPATLILGSRLTGRAYYLTGTLLIIELMLPFFLAFEGRRPKARELVLIAVMCALAIVSRAALAFLPHFKPIIGIIMITGAVFGWETGFLVGAVSAFGSNFFFGQGPWTPWQMAAYGLAGLLAGLFGKKTTPPVLALMGFFSTLLLVGPVLDLSRLFTVATVMTPRYILMVFVMGIPANIMNAVSTGLTILLLGKPLQDKLLRIRTKYGLV